MSVSHNVTSFHSSIKHSGEGLTVLRLGTLSCGGKERQEPGLRRGGSAEWGHAVLWLIPQHCTKKMKKESPWTVSVIFHYKLCSGTGVP